MGIRKEHSKIMVWPRQTANIPPLEKDGEKIYRYAVVGCIAMDHPIESLEDLNEVFIDGETEFATALEVAPKRQPKLRAGEAGNVLIMLNEL